MKLVHIYHAFFLVCVGVDVGAASEANGFDGDPTRAAWCLKSDVSVFVTSLFSTLKQLLCEYLLVSVVVSPAGLLCCSSRCLIA